MTDIELKNALAEILSKSEQEAAVFIGVTTDQIRNQRNKVLYDVGRYAEIVCTLPKYKGVEMRLIPDDYFLYLEREGCFERGNDFTMQCFAAAWKQRLLAIANGVVEENPQN